MLEILSPLGGDPLATGWNSPDSQDRTLRQKAVVAGDNVEDGRNDREHCNQHQNGERETVPSTVDIAGRKTVLIVVTWTAVGEMVDEGEDQQDQLDEVRGGADDQKGARRLHPGANTRGLLLPAHWGAAADHCAADQAEDAGGHRDRAKRPIHTGEERGA